MAFENIALDKLLTYISQLKKVDDALLDRMQAQMQDPACELDSFFSEPYPEYGSDGMKIATLINPTGEQQNFDYRDCREAKATPLLDRLPAIKSFIEDSGFHVMGSRMLRLEPWTFLHEHRDFVYLEDVPRYRLHLPLITNADAHIVSPALNVHFKRGYLWKLDPKETIHSACNFGQTSRYHLMMDCYVEANLQALIDQQWLDGDCLFAQTQLTKEIKETLIDRAQALVQAGELKAGEELLLKTFCQYDLSKFGPTSYDLVFEMYDRLERQNGFEKAKERKDYWMERLIEVYPERKSQLVAV